MKTNVITIVLAVGIVFNFGLLAQSLADYRVFGNQQGYQPEQPIAFSHLTHAGDLRISCRYCHSSVEESRHAGIPSTDTCLKCHSYVTASFGAVRAEYEQAQEEEREPEKIVSSELQKLYDKAGLNQERQPDPTKDPNPIKWVKVHNLPDYVYFDHRAHVNAGVDCRRCHGAVENMVRVKQVESLSMGWCVNCHRESNQSNLLGQSVDAPTDCSACHY